jgi:hypothetical protein
VLAAEIEKLRRMTVRQLREKHLEVFGEETRSHHKAALFKRIAWRIQALAGGGLSERARQRALEIANDADLRIRPPRPSNDAIAPPADGRTVVQRIEPGGDSRLPMPGTILVREYRGKPITVAVRENGFEYQDKIYGSLSAIAREVTGTRWNGFLFFGLTTDKEVHDAQR